jgi:guanine deaminase
MDRNSPEGLCELSARTALESVEEWLTAVSGRFAHTAPILTPRFAPSCTDELMEGLGVLADVYGLPVQSHLSETPEEVAWVKRLYPGSGSYADVYRRFGLLGSGTVMAHCVYLENEEVDIMRDAGSFVAHCPVSNTNLRSGIAPVTKYMDAGLRVGLGSDISGSHTLDMSEVLREALRVSGLHWRARGGEGRKLSPLEAFYLVTKGGGSFFGKNGSFEPGYAFDVLAIDDAWEGEAGPYSLAQRFERMLYLCSAREIRAKYVQGERLL